MTRGAGSTEPLGRDGEQATSVVLKVWAIGCWCGSKIDPSPEHGAGKRRERRPKLLRRGDWLK